jgi:hypothetical protein
MLSDGTEVELKEDGRNINVEFDNKDEYVALVLENALNES